MLRRVGYLYNPDNCRTRCWLGLFSTLAAASGLGGVLAGARATADIDGMFEKAVATGAEALIQSAGGLREGDARVSALALSHHLVSLGVKSFSAAEGILLSYTPGYVAMWRRGAYYVDRILKGARPVDLPVELPPPLT